MLSVTPDLLVFKNRDGVYQAVNPAFCKFLGKPEKEIVGKTDLDLFPQSEALVYRRDDNEVMATGTAKVQDEEATGKEGKMWLQVAKTAVLDEKGTPMGVLCSVRDITERKKSEEALRGNEACYRSLVESQTDLVMKPLVRSELANTVRNVLDKK